jgi:hypothetical protein
MKFASVPAAFAISGRGLSRPKSFVGQVMRAAKKAGHVGHSFGRGKGGASRSRFGGAGVLRSPCRCDRPHGRVVMKARVVRHHGARFRSAPLSKHITYLKREGVTRDGAEARMFDAASDAWTNALSRSVARMTGIISASSFLRGCRRARRSPHLHA